MVPLASHQYELPAGTELGGCARPNQENAGIVRRRQKDC